MKTCGECIYFDYVDDATTFGFCYANPPTVVPTEHNEDGYVSLRPRVKVFDRMCHRFVDSTDTEREGE